MKKLLIILVILSSVFILSGNVTVDTDISSTTIGLEDVLTWKVSAESDKQEDLDIKIDFKDFDFTVYGPSVSSGTSISFVNGRSTTAQSKDYTYTLKPNKKGKLQIPSMKIIVNNKTYYSKEYVIDVKEGSLARRHAPNRFGRSSIFDDFFGSPEPRRRSREEVFVEVEFSNQNVYFGEEVEVKYIVYNNFEMFGYNLSIEPHVGYGYVLTEEGEKRFQRVRKDGKIYNRKVIGTYTITPNITGKIKVPTVNIINQFYGSTYKSPDKYVNVKALPEKNKSIDFSNGIGKFTIKAKLSRHTLLVNNQCDLIVEIEGQGNLEDVIYPEAPEIEGIEFLDPTGELIQDAENNKLVLKYTIIPSEVGKFIIPPMSFNFFDKDKKDYVTVYSGEEVLKVASNGNYKLAGNSSDQFYTRNKPFMGKISHEIILFHKSWYWLLLAIALISLIAYLVLYKISKLRNSNISYVRRTSAEKKLKEAIKNAEEQSTLNSTAFYSIIENSLLSFIAKVTGVSLQKSQEEIIQALENSYIKKVTAEKINYMLKHCERIKFQPNSSNPQNLENDLNRFKDIFKEIVNASK